MAGAATVIQDARFVGDVLHRDAGGDIAQVHAVVVDVSVDGTGRAGGTGLGLYICRELCERNGANLRYRSRASGGSIFEIVFADPGRWEQ